VNSLEAVVPIICVKMEELVKKLALTLSVFVQLEQQGESARRIPEMNAHTTHVNKENVLTKLETMIVTVKKDSKEKTVTLKLLHHPEGLTNNQQISMST